MAASPGPFKRTGFNQSLYSQSNTKKEILGTLRIDQYGRGFRYARAGSSALSAGYLSVSYAINAAHVNEAGVPSAGYAAGTMVLDGLTITAGSAIAENELVGGQFQVNDAAGEGHAYMITSNSALGASDTTMNITLDRGLVVALTSSSEFTLVHNAWNDVVESTTVLMPVGVPQLAISATYYFWAQCGGPGGVYTYETTAEGSECEQSQDTAGYVNTIDTDHTEAIVGKMSHTDGVNSEFKPIHFTIW